MQKKMDALEEVKDVLGKKKPRTMFFGFTAGKQVEVLLVGDPDDMLQILVQGFHEAIGLLREDGNTEEEVRDAAEEVIADMRKALDATAKGPRLVV